MAHFAKIDENNIVQQVVVVHNNEAPTEEAGKLFLESVYKDGATWLQTSYNTHRSVHYTNGEVSTDETNTFFNRVSKIWKYTISFYTKSK